MGDGGARVATPNGSTENAGSLGEERQMATWDIAGGVVTLTLDGSDSGPLSRSRTFTGLEADELYTFYLAVNPDSVPVQAFFEVVGGDQTIATVTGAQTLVARGDADGSGELTLRFGVLDAGGAGVGADADDLDYADITAMHTAGWAETNTISSIFGGSSVHSLSADETHGGAAKSLKITLAGYTFGNRHSYEEFVFGGYTPAEAVTVKVWVWENEEETGGVRCGIRLNGDNTLPSGYTNYVSQVGTVGFWQELTATGVADGSGNVTVDLGFFLTTQTTYNRTAYFTAASVSTLGGGVAAIGFSDLPYCAGSGVGDGGQAA